MSDRRDATGDDLKLKPPALDPGSTVDPQPGSPFRVRLTEALERLVRLYEATGNKDEAAKWRKELDATKKTLPMTDAKKP